MSETQKFDTKEELEEENKKLRENVRSTMERLDYLVIFISAIGLFLSAPQFFENFSQESGRAWTWIVFWGMLFTTLLSSFVSRGLEKKSMENQIEINKMKFDGTKVPKSTRKKLLFPRIITVIRTIAYTSLAMGILFYFVALGLN